MPCYVGTVNTKNNVQSHDVGFATMYQTIVTLALSDSVDQWRLRLRSHTTKPQGES
jgi:hypothetical protein